MIQTFPQQLRVSEDARQRIVDLMRQHGRHLADGRHLLRVQRVLVGALQFAGLLLDPLFERMSPGNVFCVLGFELALMSLKERASSPISSSDSNSI